MTTAKPSIFFFASLAWIAVSMPGPAVSDPFLDPYEAMDQVPASPGVSGGAPSALANPAAWAVGAQTESAFWWDDRALREGGLGNYGLSIGRTLGFAYQRRVLAREGSPGGRRAVSDYQVGLAGGDRRAHAGIAWRWSSGDGGRVGRENGFVAGVVERPNPHLGFGASLAVSTSSWKRVGLLDAGVRPFGTPALTFFGSLTLRDDERLEDARLAGGVELRPAPGLHLGVKVRESLHDGGDPRVSLNLGLTLDGMGLHVLPSFDEGGERASTTYLVRTRPPHRGHRLGRTMRALSGDRYLSISLENKTLTYTKDRWFDTRRVAWVDLLRTLDLAAAEPSVRGVALNLAGLRTRGAIAWELRERLEALRERGIEVLIHIDHAGFVGYYLASVADVVSMDPDGRLRLPGLSMRSTYLSGMLEKLGIGFEEWRLFTHKSLLETYARTDMSDADREQRQRIVDVIYELVRDGVSSSRDLEPGAFDAIVDGDVILDAELARERGLVDRVGRWHDLGRWLDASRGVRLASLPRDLWPRTAPDERWGPPRRVALVHALGACAMDTGIRGRATSAHLRRIARDATVVGVVVRADSPGGEAMPSDLVAEGIQKVREAEKPVVVSQGSVAASGGYWLGATASRVLTTPLTATGSIGVAGGWIWDDGFGRKVGMTRDGVQRGAHADLFSGIRLPFLGVAPLPDRNLDAAERSRLDEHFLRLYDRFITHVATARGLDEAHVREVAEGRVWMGQDALARGLCDEIGTLGDALEQAKVLAGLDADAEVEIVEYPARRLFTLPRPSFLPFPSFAGLVARMGGLLGIGGASGDEPLEAIHDAFTLDPHVRAVIRSPGEALVVAPAADLPDLDVGRSERVGATSAP